MYTGVKSSKNGYKSIQYPMTDKKEQVVERVAAFGCGGGVLDTGDAASIRKQFARVWYRGNRATNVDIQGYNYLLSFSKKELDPDDPVSLYKALDVATSVMDKVSLGGDHQWIVVIQKDGRSGLLHAHGFMNSISTKDLKAARGSQNHYRALEKIGDEVLRAHGITPDHGATHEKRDKKKADLKKALGSSWLEVLEEKVRAAVGETVRKSDFKEVLKRHGVGVSRETKAGWTFELLDGEYRGKKARYDRFTSDFSNKAVNEMIDQNYKQMMETKAAAEQTKREEIAWRAMQEERRLRQ